MKRARVSECGSCEDESSENTLIHNIRHRGVIVRLCTACVLKNHPGSFCPICFEVYTAFPPPSERAICLNCPSISHLSCVVRSTSKLPPRYQCPPCSNPTFSFFDVHRYDKPGENLNAITEDTARQLLAASTIALKSLNHAVNAHRIEAERLVSEAAVANKGAKESLERLASLTKLPPRPPSTGGEKKLPPKPKTQTQMQAQMPLLAEKKMQNNAQPVKLEAKEVRMPAPPFTKQ